jgi:ribosomal protein S18 acetylase RimI-like enzyme
VGVTQLLPIDGYDAGKLARLMNSAFMGYFVHFEFNAASLSARMHFDGVDSKRSKIFDVDGKPAGLALIVPRGKRSRLATMGMTPKYRGKGLGRKFLRELLEESERCGEQAMVLEVIQQNLPAVRLYESEGFEKVRDLFGFGIEVPEGEADPTLSRVAPEELARAVTEHGDPDLPWQLSAENMARIGPQGSCFRLGPAYIALVGLGGAEVRILSLVCERGQRRTGAARRLLRAVCAAHPSQRWTVPAICPDGPARAFFAAMGFEMLELCQFEMIRDTRRTARGLRGAK